MYFIYVLVVAVAVLTILAALALVFGSSNSEKPRSLWFLSAAIGEMVWAVSIAVFLSLGTGEVDEAVAPWLVKGIYIGAILMDSSIMGYVSWKYKWGKYLTTAFLIAGLILTVIFAYDPSVLYSEIVLGSDGPRVMIDMSRGFYVAYGIYFSLLIPAFCLSLIYRIRHTSNKKTQMGYIFFLIGLAIAGGLSAVFDLFMPPMRYDLIWVGPLAIGLIILGFYFAILKFKMVSMNSAWLKVLSVIVIFSAALIVYLLLFHVVFSALFKVANPSFQVILLNFIMIAIVLALVPAISEIISLTRSLIMTKQIDLPYIVKKISTLNPKNLGLKDVSGFLAEHMHFEYVGFIINDKYQASGETKIPFEVVQRISKLPAPARGIWQNTEKLGVAAKEYSISRVALMTDANGNPIGQMVFGEPSTKSKLEHKDLVETAMIVNLIETMVEDGRRSKSKAN